jgi:hypothetical protein
VIYFETKDGKQVVVLNPAELNAIRAGALVFPASLKAVVGYNPDEKWLGEQLALIFNQQAHQLPMEQLQEILKEGLKREGVIDL